jgi:hypothetical protein
MELLNDEPINSKVQSYSLLVSGLSLALIMENEETGEKIAKLFEKMRSVVVFRASPL